MDRLERVRKNVSRCDRGEKLWETKTYPWREGEAAPQAWKRILLRGKNLRGWLVAFLESSNFVKYIKSCPPTGESNKDVSFRRFFLFSASLRILCTRCIIFIDINYWKYTRRSFFYWAYEVIQEWLSKYFYFHNLYFCN